MNYGLYLSASGVLTNMYRQDVYANNLANVGTTAFKPDIPAVTQRDPEAVEDNLGYDVSNDLLEQLGGGVFAGPQRIDFAQGAMQPSNRPLDIALARPNDFFTVGVQNPATGETQQMVTRDGRFSRNDRGELVTVAGHRVLGAGGQPITLPAGEITFDARGQLLRGDEIVGQLQIASVSDIDQLQKHGQTLFAFKSGATARPVADPQLRPGFIEASGTDPIQVMMRLTAATRAASGNARMIQYHDRLMDQAINTLGRVG